MSTDEHGGERIDLREPTAAICEALGLDLTWVRRLEWTPGTLTAELYKGTEGRMQGAKYVDEVTGEAALETVQFEVRA